MEIRVIDEEPEDGMIIPLRKDRLSVRQRNYFDLRKMLLDETRKVRAGFQKCAKPSLSLFEGETEESGNA